MTSLGDLFLTVFTILLEKGCVKVVMDWLFFTLTYVSGENNRKFLGLFAVSIEDQLKNVSCDLTT